MIHYDDDQYTSQLDDFIAKRQAKSKFKDHKEATAAFLQYKRECKEMSDFVVDAAKKSHRLSDWESRFICSIKEGINNGVIKTKDSLTPKQLAVYHKISRKVYAT